MLIQDSIKKWFYTKGTAVASSAGLIPLLDANGNPIGSDTPVNVASKLGNFFYGSCTTDATVVDKVATVDDFVLTPNSCVAIRFTKSITVANATMNVNGTGAKPMYYNGTALMPNIIRATNTALMQYDGTKYNIIAVDGDQSSGADSDLYVDMGLPSGVLWAKSNIDLTQSNGFAASPFQYECSFFSWGNVDGHNPTSTSSFSPWDWGGVNSAAPWYEGQVYGNTEGNKLTTNISPSYDAARVNLGSPWRMPTIVEFVELFNSSYIDYIDADGNVVTTSTPSVDSNPRGANDKRVKINDIVGLYLKSKINQNRLFFSCSGFGNGTSLGGRGANGVFWSSTWSSARDARCLIFFLGGVNPKSYNNRCSGFTIRPVI